MFVWVRGKSERLRYEVYLQDPGNNVIYLCWIKRDAGDAMNVPFQSRLLPQDVVELLGLLSQD